MASSRIAAGLIIAALFAARAAGQSVQPSNNTLPASESQSVTQLSLTLNPPPFGQAIYNLAPLTPNVGLGQDAQTVAVSPRPSS
jgi:hypothetical protein